MKFSKMVWFCLLILILISGTAWAGKYVAGLGAGMAPDYEGSDDYTAVPALMFKGNYDSGRYFSLQGTNFKLNVIPSKTFGFGPTLNYRMERDNVDNNQVDDMKKVDAAFEAGAFGTYNIDNFMLGLEVLTDVSGKHDGTLVKATAGYRWQAMPELMITPTIFTTYADDDYMDTYFSVDAGNRGSSNLPNYKADGGMKDVGINLAAHYTPWQHWGIMGLMSYSSLLNDAKDSPIVEDEGDKNQMFFGLMATYRWDI
jgi:outer membrane scaffolding protein for murein synthesis (MipA/OmpV family)